VLNIQFIPQNWLEAAAKMQRLPESQRRAMTRALDTFLLSVLRDSKEKPPRVPVDTGFLQGTGYTEPAKIEGPNVEAAIGYHANYAWYLHENMAGRFKNYKRPGSGPKFLITHFDARRREVKVNLEDALGEGAKELGLG